MEKVGQVHIIVDGSQLYVATATAAVIIVSAYYSNPFRSKGIRSLLIAAQLGICPGENDVGMVVAELLRGRSIEIYLLDGRKSFIERMRPNTSGNSSSNIRVCTGSHSSRVVTPNKCSTLRSSLFLHCSTRDIALQENTGF
ncbi:hypothetical protein PV326_001032 [Microctonus aethiopoides]|nr:hypothetical protein PV326_001032 [Microctonus aethiopoides]